MQHFSSFLLEFNSNLLVKRVFLLNDAFVMAILYLISSVYSVIVKYGLSEGLKVSWVIVCVQCDSQQSSSPHLTVRLYICYYPGHF